MGHLKQPQAIEFAVKQLGAKHRGYGVASAHYAQVSDALLWTLEHWLGADFTPEVKAAWVAMYGSVAAEMQRP